MPFSFVHASDLLLGAPLFAVADLLDELRGRILDARYDAARRVTDLAIDEQVDAVVFAGGVFAPAAGPRAMSFFVDECQRLEAAGIDVVWSEPESERRRWREFVPLPANVSLACPEIGQIYECVHGGASAVELLTAGSLGRPRSGASDLPRIGILPDAAGRTVPQIPDVDYWALGGRSLPGTIPSIQCLAQFSGTTQGGSPGEQGPRGCMLVHVDAKRRLSSRFVHTASLDWREEEICVDQGADWESLRGELLERVRSIARGATCEAVLVRWILRGHGIVWQQLLREDVAAQLLYELRSEFCDTRPVWSLFIEAVADKTRWDTTDFAAGRLDATVIQTSGGVHAAHVTGREPHFERFRERAGREVVAQ